MPSQDAVGIPERDAVVDFLISYIPLIKQTHLMLNLTVLMIYP